MVGRRLLVGLLLAAAACNRGESQERAAGGGPRGGGRGNDAARVVPVEVITASLGTAARTVTATGSVEPSRTVGVNSQVGGALLQVNVQEGSRVSEGAVLARIDSRELEAQLAAAEAQLELARRTAQRSDTLRAQEIVTVAEYERDQAALAAARATRDQLRLRVGYATIRAPATGVVLEKRVEAGDVVGAQTRLFTIGDVSPMVVRVPLSERDVTGLRTGDVVDVALDALPERTLGGQVRRIFPAADSITRLVPVEVALTGPGTQQARPGFMARVTFRLSPRTGVLLVPSSALLENPSGSALFVVEEGKASLRQVQRGITFQGSVEVVSGIAAGDSVVVVGNTQLRDGSTVRVVPSPTRDGRAQTISQATPPATPPTVAVPGATP